MSAYNIACRFHPAQVRELGGGQYLLILSPFQPEDQNKVAELILTEHPVSGATVEGDRAVSFTVK